MTDRWYGAFDGELDNVTQMLKNVHILRNTLEGFLMFGIAIPVAGNASNTENIEIRDNTIKTRADNPCNSIIEVGIYPRNPNTFQNVVVANNTLMARSGVGVSFDYVEAGSISDNVEMGLRRSRLRGSRLHAVLKADELGRRHDREQPPVALRAMR